MCLVCLFVWFCHLIKSHFLTSVFASPATTASEPGCPDGWYFLNDRCFALRGYGEGDQKDWRSAETACQQEAIDIGGSDGHLAEIAFDGINCK